MHYIKCAVKSTLHYSGCCRRSVAPWIPVLSWHTVFTKWVIYKFIFVWYSTEQCYSNRPTSHLVHLYTVPLLWPWQTHRQQRIWVDDFAGHCLLWPSSSKTLSGPTLGLTPNLGLRWSWLFPASSIKFLTRRSLKSLSVYLAPHADNSNQLLSTVRSRRWKYNFNTYLLLDRQKDEYLCSFFKAVPRLLISHLLQPVVWLCWGLQLLVLFFFCSPPPLLLLLKIPSQCQQPQFHWWRPQVLFLSHHFSRPTAGCLV